MHYKEKIIFTAEECDWLLQHATEYEDSTVSYDFERDPNLTSIPNAKHRVSQQCNLGQPTGELEKFLLEKLKPFDVVNLDGAYLTYVKYFKGGHFARHIDGPERYKTCIIQLSNSDSYKGGNLLVEDSKVGREIGNAVIFGANVPHELTLVEEGRRDCLVVWTAKGNTIEKKTLI